MTFLTITNAMAFACTGETTTVKTRYMVVNKEILDEHPDFLVEGAATVSQRLAITGMAMNAKLSNLVHCVW